MNYPEENIQSLNKEFESLARQIAAETQLRDAAEKGLIKIDDDGNCHDFENNNPYDEPCSGQRYASNVTGKIMEDSFALLSLNEYEEEAKEIEMDTGLMEYDFGPASA